MLANSVAATARGPRAHEDGDGLRRLPRGRMDATEIDLDKRAGEAEISGLTMAAGQFQHRRRLGQVALEVAEDSLSEPGLRYAVELLGSGGDLEGLAHPLARLDDLPTLAEAPHQPRAREERGRARHAHPAPRHVSLKSI